MINVFYGVNRTLYQRKNPDPGFWHDDDWYFDGHSHFSIPLAGFLLNIVQPSDEFSEISPLLWVLLFGKDLEIANDPVCIGFATSKVTPSKVERVAPSASENQIVLTNTF